MISCAATNASFQPLTPVLPAGVDRYRLQIEPVAVAYQLRFSGEATGFTVPANTLYTFPEPLVADVVAEIKLASTTATVRALVSFPSV